MYTIPASVASIETLGILLGLGLLTVLLPALLLGLLKLPSWLAYRRIKNYLQSCNINTFTEASHYITYAINKGYLLFENKEQYVYIKTPQGRTLGLFSKDISGDVPIKYR